jgi:hypothetical protein
MVQDPLSHTIALFKDALTFRAELAHFPTLNHKIRVAALPSVTSAVKVYSINSVGVLSHVASIQ